MFKDDITIIDDVLSKEECKELIRYYDSAPIQISSGYNYHFKTIVSRHTRLPFDDFVKAKLTKVMENIPDTVLIQRAQLECRNNNIQHDAHFDARAGDWGSFTTVLYLNDEYEGGNTFVNTGNETINIKPKAGRMVGFNGHKLEHGVSLISGSKRYTLAIWYTIRPDDLPQSFLWWMKC